MLYSLKRAFFSYEAKGRNAIFSPPSLLLQNVHDNDEQGDFLLHQAAESLQTDDYSL